jgi:hypothetical protein
VFIISVIATFICLRVVPVGTVHWRGFADFLLPIPSVLTIFVLVVRSGHSEDHGGGGQRKHREDGLGTHDAD